MPADLLANEALSRAIVVGVFGGAALTLTQIYSRRGPMIYPVYAAILAALAMLLVRYPLLTFAPRFVAALAGFVTASAILYVTVGILGERQRREMARQGHTLTPAPWWLVGVVGLLRRWGFLLAIGSVVSAGIAFVAG